MNIRITDIFDSVRILNTVFWYAPMDAYLRAFEIPIWNKIVFKKPTLDIGCGDGRIDTLLFKNKVIDVALDTSHQAVIVAKDNQLYKEVVEGSAENIPFKDKYFNTVILNSTFEHIKNDAKALREISRVLKIGGRLHFTTTSDNLKNELVKLMDNRTFVNYNDRVEHRHYRSNKLWSKLFTNNGLKVIEHFTYFTKNDLKYWYIFHRLFTCKYRGREVWSYLKDSKYSKYLPGNIIALVETLIMKKLIDKNTGSGLWQYFSVEKIK